MRKSDDLGCSIKFDQVLTTIDEKFGVNQEFGIELSIVSSNRQSLAQLVHDHRSFAVKEVRKRPSDEFRRIASLNANHHVVICGVKVLRKVIQRISHVAWIWFVKNIIKLEFNENESTVNYAG